MRILGVDVSLTGCGVCVLPDNWAAGSRDWSQVRTDTFGVKLGKDASEDERAERLDRITSLVARFAAQHDADVAVFEQYAFGAQQANARAVAELGGCLRLSLHRLAMSLHAVHSASARKVLLGKVPVGRQMAKAAAQRFLRDMGAPFWERSDEVDAFACCNWFLADQGFTFVGQEAA